MTDNLGGLPILQFENSTTFLKFDKKKSVDDALYPSL